MVIQNIVFIKQLIMDHTHGIILLLMKLHYNLFRQLMKIKFNWSSFLIPH